MSIYEYDEEKTMRMLREEAYEEAIEIGIRTTIETCMEFNAPSALIIQKLISQFHLSEEKAQAYLNEYLSQNSKHPPITTYQHSIKKPSVTRLSNRRFYKYTFH